MFEKSSKTNYVQKFTIEILTIRLKHALRTLTESLKIMSGIKFLRKKKSERDYSE